VRDLEEPPAELLDSLVGRISARRRARRWRGVIAAAAAAVIAIGGGIGGGVLISQGQGGGGTFDLVRASGAHTTAAIYYGPRNAGTSLQVQVSGIPNGTYCELWVTTSGGQHVLVGGWVVNGTHGNWYEAASSVATGKIRSFDITAAGKVLVNVLAT
jgi:anti-sigma-K factor RskA